jgi:hypothetical protein
MMMRKRKRAVMRKRMMSRKERVEAMIGRVREINPPRIERIERIEGGKVAGMMGKVVMRERMHEGG